MQNFGVLRFSPTPEILEPRNVALVLAHNRGSRLEFDPAFPRLRCAAPGLDLSGLVRTLEWLSSELVTRPVPDALLHLVRLNRKFSFDGPYRTASAHGPQLHTLRTTYLDHPRAGTVDGRELVARAFEQRLNHYILDQMAVPAAMMYRRPRPERFLVSAKAQALAKKVNWSRVVSGSAGAVSFLPVDVSGPRFADQLSRAAFAASIVQQAKRFESGRRLLSAILVIGSERLEEGSSRAERVMFSLEDTRARADFMARPGVDDSALRGAVRSLVENSSDLLH